MNFNAISKFRRLLNGFWRYNFVSNFTNLTPKSVIINLTYKCNSKCIMCNIWKMKSQKELSYNEWKKYLNDPIFKEIEDLTISGGEAFLFEDFSKTIKLFIDHMPKLRRLVVNTNGFFPDKIIKDTDIISKYCLIKKIKLIVSFSIDGVGKEHSEIRGIDGGFEKCMETLTKLKELSIKNNFSVGIASLLMNRNIEKYEEMKKWLESNEVDYSFQLIGFHDTYVNNLEKEDSLNFGEKGKKTLLKILDGLRKNKKITNFGTYYWDDMYNLYKNKRRRSTPCSFLKDDFVIDSLGDVYYCLSVRPIGNFIKEKRSIGNIYFDKKNIKFRKSLWNNQCRFCNSGCNVSNSIAYDLKKYLWFKLTA